MRRPQGTPSGRPWGSAPPRTAGAAGAVRTPLLLLLFNQVKGAFHDVLLQLQIGIALGSKDNELLKAFFYILPDNYRS